jgi:hypothetical protein
MPNTTWFREDTEVIDFFAPPRDDFLLAASPPTWVKVEQLSAIRLSAGLWR